MKVALFGGTGFVGSYLVDELLSNGHKPRVLVRPGSAPKLRRHNDCEMVSGDIGDAVAVGETLSGSDAAIYNIGLLREFPKRGITFQRMHFEGAKRCIDIAVASGLKRFLLMSANGVSPYGTAYQLTKFAADEYLQKSTLDWTIFRPSVMFGAPRGRMEFATQLHRDLVSRPIPAPLFHNGLLPTAAGEFEMSPVYVGDVAKIFVASLNRAESIGAIHCLGGPRTLSWKAILQTIADATGRNNLTLPAPAWAVKTVAKLMQRFERFPLTVDQLTMLMEGNHCDSTALFREYGIETTPFDSTHLAYLQPTASLRSTTAQIGN